MKKYFFKNYIFIFFIKILTLAYFGPQLMPDSSGYIDESTNLFKSLPFRNYGYPIIIYILKYFENWMYYLIFVQLIITSFTSYIIYKSASNLKISKKCSFFIVLFFNFSILFFLDFCILPDSLLANLFTLVLCNFLSIFIKKKDIFSLAFLNAILFITCFFLKSQFLYFLPIFSIILVSLIKVIKLKKFLIVSLIFISPILIVTESIKLFHYSKFSQKVISSSDNTIYLFSLIKPYKNFNMQNLNNNDDDFNLVLKSKTKSEDFMVTYQIINELKKMGYNNKEISEIIKNKYFETIYQNPEYFFIKIFYNLKPTAIWGMFQPFLNYSQIYSLRVQNNDFWRFRLLLKNLLTNFQIPNLALILLIFLEMVIATLVFFYVYYNFIRQYFKKKNYFLFKTNSNGQFLVSLMIFYSIYMLMHLIVHIEPRYMAPVNIIPIIYFFHHYLKIKD